MKNMLVVLELIFLAIIFLAASPLILLKVASVILTDLVQSLRGKRDGVK